MNYNNGVQTGRTLPRERTYECHSCHRRNAVGIPKNLDTWPARLHGNPLTVEQADLLLVAAVEFNEHCQECRNCNHDDHLTICRQRDEPDLPPCECTRYEPRGWDNAVAFVDWLRPDALGLVVNFTVSNEATRDRARGVAS